MSDKFKNTLANILMALMGIMFVLMIIAIWVDDPELSKKFVLTGAAFGVVAYILHLLKNS